MLNPLLWRFLMITKKKSIYVTALITISVIASPASSPTQSHEYFADQIHATITGESHHHYYNSQHPVTLGNGLQGLFIYAAKVGIITFVSEAVALSFKTGLSRLCPQLYSDKETLKSKHLLAQKADLENKLTALGIKEKEQKILEQSNVLLAHCDKQLAQLRGQPLTPEQEDRRNKLSSQSLELLELQCSKIKQFLSSP